MVDNKAPWRIGELAEQVAACLADGYAASGNRRVRRVPDVRAIRWYTTTGLLDPPLEHRGRTAYYGIRHLHQLVAIKRLQSQGMPLAHVQQRLSGCSDAELEELAAVPMRPTRKQHATPETVRRAAPEFWKPRPREESEADARDEASSARPTLSYGIEVSDDVTILVRAGRPPKPDDATAIAAAAGAVMEELTERGLIQQGDRDHDHHSR